MQTVADISGVGFKYGGRYAEVLYGRPLFWAMAESKKQSVYNIRP